MVIMLLMGALMMVLPKFVDQEALQEVQATLNQSENSVKDFFKKE
jgi:hypothetical protein